MHEDIRGRQPSTSQAERRPQKLNIFGTLILDLDSPELWENEFLLCEWPSWQCILMAAWEDWCPVPSSLRSHHPPHSVFGVHVPGTVQGLFAVKWCWPLNPVNRLENSLCAGISLDSGDMAENETISCPQGVYTLVEKKGNSAGEGTLVPQGKSYFTWEI